MSFVLLLAGPALAQERFENVEYVSGKAGFEKKEKGVLYLEEGRLRFADKKGNTIFSMPLESITEVEATREHEEGSFGRKMALGIFASKNQEYLLVKTETADAAEAITFKCKKKTSETMATKINFALKQLRGETD